MERFAIKIDKNLRANLYKICRLCGIDNPDKVKVLDDETIVNLEDGEPELWKKVLDCIGLLITKDDKMPQFMCTLCVDKINDFFEFREMCYATDGQTRKLLGIKEEPKLQITPSIDYKTDMPGSVVSGQRVGRKRRNADMEICSTSKEIKIDETDDDIPTTTNASKKKRPKLENTETDIKPEADGSKSGLSKKRLKIEAIAKDKKEVKQTKVSKLTQKKLKAEISPAAEQEERKNLSLPMQKKKKALELLKQRNLAKKVAVVKVEKLRKVSADAKIKEEAPVPAPSLVPAQPKVKLKDKCAICGEGFLNKALLDKHIKSTHIPTIVRYHCVQCNETLKKNMEIKNHNLWHKLSKTPFRCGYCSESSCSIYTYSKHIRDCGQVSYLDAHIPDWHCPECSGVFETTYLFNIHSCVSNTLVCPGCDRSLKWKEDYFKHIPTCPAAVHRIPSYMSPNIQVKNEAENPISPVSQHSAQTVSSMAGITVQPTPPSRITPPSMDSNQCVVIPGNVNLLEEGSSPSSKSGSKKSKRITKKDLKRFDKLLKSTMTTLVSIKQEPSQSDTEDEEQSTSSDVRAASESPPRSPSPADDDFHYNDDSADEQTSSQPVGKIKQEIIDEGYRDLCTNIEVNIKREIVLNDNSRSEVATPNRKENNTTEAVAAAEPVAPKPILKLKITKEHGTLNSILLDSPKSEKKKKKKKRKEDKLKSAEKKETSAIQKVKIDVLNVPDVTENVEAEPVMPLPEIIHVKEEITELNEGELKLLLLGPTDSGHNTPSIVAATSGSLQITSVSEGVHFNGTEENADEEEERIAEQVHSGTEEERESEAVGTPIVCEEQQDIKPRLEDLIPMLRIASVSSGEDIIKNTAKLSAKRKRYQKPTAARSSFSTPQIVSVSSGSQVVAYVSELEKLSVEDEEPFEMIDNNENIFDYTQVRIKEEVVDITYGNPDCKMTQEEELGDKEVEENTITEKEAEENSYIASIDFNNLTIKQEKEYIDDGLYNATGFENEDSSDSEDSESSSDTEKSDSESEREYRELPSEDDESDSHTIAPPILSPLGLKILSVHSEFNSPQADEKTESELGVQLGSEDRITSNPTFKFNDLKMSKAHNQGEHPVACEIPPKESHKLYSNQSNNECSNILIEGTSDNKNQVSTHKNNFDWKCSQGSNQPSTSTARNMGDDMDRNQTKVVTGNSVHDVVLESIHCIAEVHRLKEQIESADISANLDDFLEGNAELKPTANSSESSCNLKINHASISPTIDSINTYNIPQDVVELSPPEIFSEVQHQTLTSNLSKINSDNSSELVDLRPSCPISRDVWTLDDDKLAGESNQISTHERKPHVSTVVSNYSSDDHNIYIERYIEDIADINRQVDEVLPCTTAQGVEILSTNKINDQASPMEAHDTNMLGIKNIFESNYSKKITDKCPSDTIVQYVDDHTMSDIAPAVSKINQLIHQSPPATTTDDGIRYSAATVLQLSSTVISQESTDQTSLTEVQDVDDFTAADIVPNVMDFQPSDAETDYVAPNMIPISMPQNLIDLSTYDPEKDMPHLSSSSQEGVKNSESPSRSIYSIKDRMSLKSIECNAAQDNLKQIKSNEEFKNLSIEIEQHSTPIPPPTLQCITESTDLPSVPQCASQNIAVYPSIDSIESHIPSSISIESGRHHFDTSTIPHTNEISVSIDLSDILSNSTLHVPVSVLPSEQCKELSSSSHIINETASNIPSCSTDQKSFTSKSSYIDTNINFTELGRSRFSQANLTESVDLNTITAGQLHTLITPIQPPLTSDLEPIDADLSVPVLSEEVQNILNEDTSAATNFALNDNILRARCSTSVNAYTLSAPAAVSVPNFIDLENVNEIAENNNNANIERELQDELGNVLAAAIADRSSNDEADDNNVMNENQANFNIS